MKTKSKKDIILETSKAYNSQNLSISEEGNCAYQSGVNKCAVGRCLLAKSKLFNPMRNFDPISIYDEDSIDKEFKVEYRGHSLDFWVQLQGLHDKKDNWDINGLTDKGQKHTKNLLETWGNK